MVLVATTATADAFTAPTTTTRGGGIAFSSLLPPPSALGASSSSDPVDVLSDYMTKSHEEKLRAIKSVEDKKNIEISVLKAEIERLKSSSPSSSTTVAVPPPPSPSNLESNTMDISEMQSKLASYQSFMAEYIVDSQNQKLAAVKEAESRVEKKFMEKIEKLLSLNGGGGDLGVNGIAAVATSPAADAATISTIAGVGEQSVFQKRNNQILQAADANKSRWGSMEIERAKKEQMLSPPPLQSSSAAAKTVFDRRNDQVIASAAAGKSRWGGKEVERAMKNGVSVAVPAATATLFDRRNAQVIASAAAGKSRWGGMEVERAMKNGVVVGGGQCRSPSGAVVTLEERVNLGARLLGVWETMIWMLMLKVQTSI